jgi:hypothetical protein
MSDAQKQIAEATASLAAKQKEIAELEATALAHEASAREARTKRSELKKECEQLTVVLRHSVVQNTLDNAQAAAAKAQAAAEKAQKEAEAHREEAAEVLAKLKEQTQKAE